CHDHKTDPVTTRDYYGLYAIFKSTNYPWAGSEPFETNDTPRQGFAPLVPPEEAGPRVTAYSAQVASLEKELKQAEAAKKPTIELDRLKKALRSIKRRGMPADLPCAYAVNDGPSVTTFIQRGGNPADKGESVSASIPAVFSPAGSVKFPKESSGRLQL